MLLHQRGTFAHHVVVTALLVAEGLLQLLGVLAGIFQTGLDFCEARLRLLLLLDDLDGGLPLAPAGELAGLALFDGQGLLLCNSVVGEHLLVGHGARRGDLEKARQSIRQSSYEAEAIGELGTSETERQIAAAELDIKRLDAERELEMMEVQMGLREPEPIEAAPTEETASPQAEETEEEPRGQ